MSSAAKKKRPVFRCFECGLPDPYNGGGDGIGSCECPRCEYCGWPPGVCNCSDDDYGWPEEDETP